MQPHAEPMSLDVLLGAVRRRDVGLVYDDDECMEDMRFSYRALDELAAEGLLRRHGEVAYMLEFHFSNAADWAEFLARPKAGRVEADPDLLASALADSAGSIITSDRTTITAFDRVP